MSILSQQDKLELQQKIFEKAQKMPKGGVTFKNYIDLCEYFKIERLLGNSKKAQLKIIESCMKIARYGNKLQVQEIYDTPKPIIEHKPSNNRKYNSYDLESEDYGIGYTENGQKFWFDKEDFELIAPYYWSYSNNYVVSAIYILDENGNKKKKNISLHRFVMGVNDPDLVVDHIVHPSINENKYDNRKSNLRVVTRDKNRYNCHPSKNNKTGHSGVTYNKTTDKWAATIGFKRRNIYLGIYKTKEEAVAARKVAQKILFGEYDFDANNLDRFTEVS